MRSTTRNLAVGLAAAVALGASASLATANDDLGLATGTHTIVLPGVGDVVITVGADGKLATFAAPEGYALVPGTLEGGRELEFTLRATTDPSRALQVEFAIAEDGALSVEGEVEGMVGDARPSSDVGEPIGDDVDDEPSVETEDSPASEPSVDDTADEESPASEPSVDDTTDEESPASEPSVDDTADEESPASEPSVDDTADEESPASEPSVDDTADEESPASEPSVDDTTDEESPASEPSEPSVDGAGPR